MDLHWGVSQSFAMNVSRSMSGDNWPLEKNELHAQKQNMQKPKSNGHFWSPEE